MTILDQGIDLLLLSMSNIQETDLHRYVNPISSLHSVHIHIGIEDLLASCETDSAGVDEFLANPLIFGTPGVETPTPSYLLKTR